jgi:hypothetical protein
MLIGRSLRDRVVLFFREAFIAGVYMMILIIKGCVFRVGGIVVMMVLLLIVINKIGTIFFH